MAELEERKQELIRQLDQSRGKLSAHARGARAHANPVTNLRRSVSKHPLAWIGSGALAAILFAKWPKRSRKVTHTSQQQLVEVGKSSLLLAGLKLAFDLTRPFLMGWATDRLADLATNFDKKNGPRK